VSPDFLSERWWDWVFIHYRTTILVLGGVAAGITAITKTKIDDKILEAIKRALPWNRAPKEDHDG
jgi:hypothetical protein